MIKVISSNDSRGTCEVVIISKEQRGKKSVNVSRTKHLAYDAKDKVWRDNKGSVIDLTK